jgi:hypothetical protein
MLRTEKKNHNYKPSLLFEHHIMIIYTGDQILLFNTFFFIKQFLLFHKIEVYLLWVRKVMRPDDVACARIKESKSERHRTYMDFSFT